MATLWPGGARGCICLTFDNLGEAAEIELGASTEADAGDHFTATEVVPELLDHLAEHKLPATFFVEGLNTRLYPDTLKSIDTAGHEIAYHAWRHEDWRSLDAAEQTANLERGIAAFRELGIEISGLRPPGGALGEGGTGVMREAGLPYCSPAGAGAGVDAARGGAGGAAGVIALLPFQWRHVDASCLLPPLAPVREQMTGSPDPIDPAGFVDYLSSEIDRLRTEGGYLSIVLHLYLVHHWLGEESLGHILNKLSTPQVDGDLWIAPMRDVASYILEHPDAFINGAVLDPTSWT
ncbi:MAG TPA: polysaccharide deacetylase family protein [Thermoanaerobaculia bacterium]|nr:polysaccharide deacetylase family protein [Thermoanaerobaculia bacterium]